MWGDRVSDHRRGDAVLPHHPRDWTHTRWIRDSGGMGLGDLVHRAQQHRARRQAAPHRATPRLRAHARLDAGRAARGGRARQHLHLARREGPPRRGGAPLRREQRRATPARPGRAPRRARRGPSRPAARRPVDRDARPRPRRDGVKGGPGQRRGDGRDPRGREVRVLQARRRVPSPTSTVHPPPPSAGPSAPSTAPSPSTCPSPACPALPARGRRRLRSR